MKAVRKRLKGLKNQGIKPKRLRRYEQDTVLRKFILYAGDY